MNLRWKGVLTFIFALMAGCTNGQEGTEEQPEPADPSASGYAIKDLSDRLGVPAVDVTLVNESDVTWRDGSLGCPQEGMMYTQALVEGQRIVLQVDGIRYHYHAGNGRLPFYCENPVSPAPGYSVE